jgi:hypothetical protein
MATPPMTFYGISVSTDVGDIKNLEVNYITEPMDFDAPIPFTSRRPRRMDNGAMREDGHIDSAVVMRLARRADLDTLIYAIYGGWEVSSVERAASLRDERGGYSPYLLHLGKPQISFPTGGYWRTQVLFPCNNCRLQTVTKTANYTVTVDDRFIYANTARGSITLALPAVATVNPYTIYTAIKTASANNLVLDPSGAETISGASTLTKTVVNTRVDFWTDAVAWYVKDPD